MFNNFWSYRPQIVEERLGKEHDLFFLFIVITNQSVAQ